MLNSRGYSLSEISHQKLQEECCELCRTRMIAVHAKPVHFEQTWHSCILKPKVAGSKKDTCSNKWTYCVYTCVRNRSISNTNMSSTFVHTKNIHFCVCFQKCVESCSCVVKFKWSCHNIHEYHSWLLSISKALKECEFYLYIYTVGLALKYCRQSYKEVKPLQCS